MSNNRVTPFIKRMRATGGTIYTFSSAVEDIGLNINERNNVVKISHFALLEIPQINEPTTTEENRFNVLAIPGAFEYWKTPPYSTKDGRVLIAESFQNYALNFESNLLNQSTYDPTLSKTVSERVFWKWLKETGAIRWANPSNGYWSESPDSSPDGSVGYNTVVKYVGAVSAGNVRNDSFGTYNETYIMVPTSHGQMEVYFEQSEDSNYYHGLQIGNLGEFILGRETYTKPHPDALDYYGYYDFMDSASSIAGYNLTCNGSTGWWYTQEGISPTADNTYLTDTSAYLTTLDFDASLRYDNSLGDYIEFKRSKVDCMGLVLDLNKLQGIPQSPWYGDTDLTFDKMAIEYSLGVNDSFTFNTVLIYYSVYNATQDTILATNLLGVLFLDAPSGNTSNIGFSGITIPSLEKIQSGVGGFGTSYALRLNIKTDNMVDDTAAPIVDGTTTLALWESDQWTQAFYELEKAVNILTRNNSVLSYISGQYAQMQSVQTQMLNQIAALQWQVNDIQRDIAGTENALAMFADGDDPLVDSSIYMKFGKIGLFTDDPKWPVQIDASVKSKDIYIEKAIRDTSGNILIGYGSPLQIGSSTDNKELSIYSSGTISAAMDTSIRFFKDIHLAGQLFDQSGQPISSESGIYVAEASLGNSFSWIVNPGFLEVDVSSAFESIRDNYIPDASLGDKFVWDSNNFLDVSMLFIPDACDNLTMLNSVGGFDAGTTVGDLRGKSYDSLWLDLLFPTINPTYVAPSCSVDDAQNPLQEIGLTMNITFTNTLNRGQILVNGTFQNYRSGPANSYNWSGFGLSTPTGGNTNNNPSYTVVIGNQTCTASVDYDQGPQPLDSKGNPYDSPLSAGTTPSATHTIEGVYPLFGTTSSISNPNTQQALVSMLTGNSVVFAMVTESGGNKQSFDIPTAWTGAPTNRPLSNVQTYNTVSSAWETTGLGQWTTSSVTHTVQGSTINYTRYTYNGSDRGNVSIRLVF